MFHPTAPILPPSPSSLSVAVVEMSEAETAKADDDREKRLVMYVVLRKDLLKVLARAHSLSPWRDLPLS